MTTPSTDIDTRSARRPRSRKATRTSFGSVRRLPSGRFQARYTDRQMNRHTAPQTFATKSQAEDWLATVRADVVRGTWRAPSLGAVMLAEYAAEHLATRVDLAPRTQHLYASVLANWIAAPLELPMSAGRSRTINLGESELSALSVASIREWHAAAIHTAQRSVQARAADSWLGSAARTAFAGQGLRTTLDVWADMDAIAEESRMSVFGQDPVGLLARRGKV